MSRPANRLRRARAASVCGMLAATLALYAAEIKARLGHARALADWRSVDACFLESADFVP